MMIFRAKASDAVRIAQLAAKLWPDNTAEKLVVEFDKLISDKYVAIFICCESNKIIGFAQCQLRSDYVEGTSSSPVGYLEGIFVEESYRKQGYAKQLLLACETWAKEQGCTEFASDCELDNLQSIAFHHNNGFDEVNRIVCFVKRI